MITTEPPAEVAAAGHDRSPIQLSKEHAQDFINLKSPNKEAFLKLLASPRPSRYVVDLG